MKTTNKGPMCPMARFEEYCFKDKCAWWIESNHMANSDGSPCGSCAVYEMGAALANMIADGLPLKQ